MLTRKLSTIWRKGISKYLSTLSQPKTESNSPANNSPEYKAAKMLKVPDYFKVHNLFTVKDLFEAKVHYGHKTTCLNDKMKPFIFGSRLGHTIFDLDITAYHLREALNFTAHIAFRDGIILFVSKNPQMTLLVERTALECKEFAVTREWRLGTFSNSEKVFQCITRLPELCIVLNTLEENGTQHRVVVDAAKMCIPTVGIVDSNCNPNLITYPVPGNDDSLSCFKLYCKLFKEAIFRGKEERRRFLEEFAKTQEEEEGDSETQIAK